MNVISIDHSKVCTGIFTRIDGIETTLTIKNDTKCPIGNALINIYTQLKQLLATFKFHFGLIEIPRNASFSMQMFEIGGVIRMAFAECKIPLIGVYVQTWKTLTIKSLDKHKKVAYLKAVKEKYDREFKTTDEADAFMIYRAVKIIAGKTRKFTKGMQKIKDQLSKIIDDHNKAENINK